MANYQSSYTGAQIDTAVAKINNLLDVVYPVGSIYMSVNSTNPATFIGGTWARITDCFLLASGLTYAPGTTGGNTTHVHTTAGHTLTVAEMPSHNHDNRVNGDNNYILRATASWGTSQKGMHIAINNQTANAFAIVTSYAGGAAVTPMEIQEVLRHFHHISPFMCGKEQPKHHLHKGGELNG